jgi:predicted Zn-dependent peptidase
LARRLMLALREAHYPSPYGRAQYGTAESVSRITLADVQQHVGRHYSPRGAILGVAGKVDWPQLRDLVERQFGPWQPQPPAEIQPRPAAGGYKHLNCDSAQTHVGVAYPSVPYSHDDYYRAWSAVSVLSDGMSSRLFTEVREERGLCYTVDASYHALRDRASVQCYAGTTTDRAQQTLDVVLAELEKLARGIHEDELARLKARCKSALIMQQESSSARSSTIASQWYFLGRVRTLEEVGRKIDALTCESINGYLADNPPGPYTIATLGAHQLETPLEVS